MITDTIQLVSVAVGKPTVIGQNRHGDVISGIAKYEITGPQVMVTSTNIDGDGQADLVNHGGLDKAVYCYPREHRTFWRTDLGYDLEEAPFGENLSVLGIQEQEACIGDVWEWGGVRLQISQPRWPCYKLALHSGHLDMIKRFVASGRSGWYLRVLQAGEAPVGGTIEVVERDPARISIHDCYRAKLGELSPEELARVLGHPLLAAAWKS